jgi:hypothetical protein
MQNPTTEAIAAKFFILRPLLDECARRLWAAVEARTMGRGGISRVAEATGLTRVTIRAGLQELALAGTAPGRKRPLNGCAAPEGDASHWACMIRISGTPWKPWSIR